LDALMADLAGGSAKRPASPQVARAAPAPAPAAAKKGDDLDDLMASLSSNSRSTTNITKPRGDDELDAMMAGLRNGSPQAARPPAAYNPPPAAYNAPPAAAEPPRAAGRSRFDTLMTDVSSQMDDLSKAPARSRGICSHCRNNILGECIQALGRTYHPEHFVCGTCTSPIGSGSFFELEGQPQCERCYQLQFCPKCAHCNQAISDRCVTAMNKKWHMHCFVCTQCLQPFNGTFFERDQRPYCEKCFYQVFAPRCRACNQPILGDCINALGSQWHPEHFNCQFCHKAFTGTFYEFEGLPYCEVHYYARMGTSCAGCQQPITGASVDALGKKWHPEHFVCAFCMNSLAGQAFSEKNQKPYCKPCFTKLFT
jgi:paxillin